ncbi:MAG: Abi family protein [Rhodocyclaceae bacterium]|nr:Abi family protein [Rhodocyclaceae bacterium]
MPDTICATSAITGWPVIRCRSRWITTPTVRTRFLDGVCFEDILDLCVFDRKLRLAVMDAVERIEVAFRAQFSQTMSELHGSHWFMDAVHFQPRYDHADFIFRIKKDIGYDNAKAAMRQTFIKHYYDRYGEPELPPSWMIFEVLSFGTVSLAFKNLTRQNQKPVAKPFGLAGEVLASWLHALSYLRNLAAHHQRLWNRTYTIKPIQAKRYADELQDTSRFYAQAVMADVLLKVISPDTRWGQRLAELLAEHPKVQARRLGFPRRLAAKTTLASAAIVWLTAGSSPSRRSRLFGDNSRMTRKNSSPCGATIRSPSAPARRAISMICAICSASTSRAIPAITASNAAPARLAAGRAGPTSGSAATSAGRTSGRGAICAPRSSSSPTTPSNSKTRRCWSSATANASRSTLPSPATPDEPRTIRIEDIGSPENLQTLAGCSLPSRKSCARSNPSPPSPKPPAGSASWPRPCAGAGTGPSGRPFPHPVPVLHVRGGRRPAGARPVLEC